MRRVSEGSRRYARWTDGGAPGVRCDVACWQWICHEIHECERDPRLCMSMPVALNHRGNDVATHVAHAGHEDLLPKAKFPLPRSTT